jgi:signal transduction histidine kinase
MANKEDGGTFSENDLRLLATFASQAAVAVDDANQFEKNRRRLIEFEILHEISMEMRKIQSVSEFRTILGEKLQRVFPVDYSLWFNWNSEARVFELGAASGTKDIPLTESGSIDLSSISREQISLTIADIDEDQIEDIAVLTKVVAEHLKENPHLPKPGRAFMAVPIIRHDQLAHVFCLGADSEQAYSADDISLSRLVISQAALLFEREKALLNATRLLTMGNMISEISHDLRRPLTSIKGGLQIVRQRFPEIEQSELIQMVDSEIHRMNELVRELVDFSNPNKYQTEKIDLREIIKRAGDLVTPDLLKRKINIEYEFDKANYEILVNKNQIIEVLLNLFMNAIDAMPSGGKLRITGLVEKPEHKLDDYLAVKVTDTGIGIKKDKLSRVFDRYYTSKETGTGLGLAVVERVLSAHNGTLAVESEEGQGTTFTLYFPYVV